MFAANRKMIAAVAIVTSALASPALAQALADRFKQGQQLVRSGELDAALVEFTDLREQYPNDVDYALARAQVLTRMGRDSDALVELVAATGLAPDYEEVWRLHYAILSAQVDSGDVAELEELRLTAAGRFPQATWWHRPKDPDFWTVVAGSGYDQLSDGLPSWNNQFLDVSRDHDERNQYGLQLARDERYDTASYSLGLRARHTLLSGLFVGASMSMSDDSVILPEMAYNAFLGMPIEKGWVAGISHRRREYQDVTVGALVGSVEKYHGDFRFAYELTRSHLHGASSFFNHTLATNWYFSDKASIGVTISDGQEAESLGNGQVLESDVRGLSIGGRYQFDGRYGLQWWLGTHEQGDFYRRRFLGLAISIRI